MGLNLFSTPGRPGRATESGGDGGGHHPVTPAGGITPATRYDDNDDNVDTSFVNSNSNVMRGLADHTPELWHPCADPDFDATPPHRSRER